MPEKQSLTNHSLTQMHKIVTLMLKTYVYFLSRDFLLFFLCLFTGLRARAPPTGDVGLIQNKSLFILNYKWKWTVFYFYTVKKLKIHKQHINGI